MEQLALHLADVTRVNLTFHTRCGRPEMSIAARVIASSIGRCTSA